MDEEAYRRGYNDVIRLSQRLARAYGRDYPIYYRRYKNRLKKMFQLGITAGGVALGTYAVDKAKEKSIEAGYQAINDFIYGNKTENKIFSNNNTMVLRPKSKPRGKFIAKKTVSYNKRVAKTTQQSNSGQTVFKKPFPKKVYTKKKPFSKSIVKKVNELTKAVKADQAYHTYKKFYAYQRLASVGKCDHYEWDANGAVNLEASVANLRYYDPSAPATLTTANASTGSYSRQVHFKNIYSRMDVMNNYQIPCKVKIYLVKPKGDTTILPLTYYENGITDQVISGGNRETAGIFLTDIDVFNEQYSAKVMKDVILQPGASISVSHSSGSFDYDPSLFDSHTLYYQTKFKNFHWIIRIEGLIGHDTTVSTEVGILQAGVDVNHYEKYEIVYDAGVNLNDIYVSDNRDTSFTNGGVVSNKPIADNQSYSVA